VARLRHWAVLDPDRIAIRFVVDVSRREETLTYRELDVLGRRWAATLLQHAAPGDRVLLLLPTGFDYIAAFIGCLYAGLIAVPGSPAQKGERHFVRRLQAMRENCKPSAAVVPADDEVTARLIVDVTILTAGAPLAQCLEDVRLPVGDDIAFLQYSSGSMAAPKGVIVGHANLQANIEVLSRAWRTSREDVLVSWLPLFHVRLLQLTAITH
jgi:acyl-CoA synthetase (AMP-forming)/AMP-acid ligase II